MHVLFYFAFSFLRDEGDDEKDKNNRQKDLDHEPSIRGQVSVVSQKLILSLIDVQLDIIRVGLDSLNCIPLFCHHLSELLKDSTELLERRLDRLNGRGPVLNILFRIKQEKERLEAPACLNAVMFEDEGKREGGGEGQKGILGRKNTQDLAVER